MSLSTANRGRLSLSAKAKNKSLRRKPIGNAKKGKKPGKGIVHTFMALLAGLLFLACLSVLLLYGYRWLTVTPLLGISEIEVTGNSRLSRGEIMELGRVGLGLNCMDMNVSAVERHISNNPWISSVKVRRELPDKVRIAVTERVPRFWLRKGTALYYGDREGNVIAPLNPGEYASLPMLEVDEGVVESPDSLRTLVEKMDARELPFGPEQTAWIRLMGSRQVEIHLDGQELTLRMDMSRWQEQLARIQAVWRDLARRGEFYRTEMITATGGKVWVKLRG